MVHCVRVIRVEFLLLLILFLVLFGLEKLRKNDERDDDILCTSKENAVSAKKEE